LTRGLVETHDEYFREKIAMFLFLNFPKQKKKGKLVRSDEVKHSSVFHNYHFWQKFTI